MDERNTAQVIDEQGSGSDSPQQEWALKLFRKSPLKQKKFSMLRQYCGDTEHLNCLDIGSDNGVISLLLRQRGGIWHSADLIPETVASIRQLVGDRVEQISGLKTPYNDDQFDLVVIVDFLEHIESDHEFVRELFRIIRPGGTLIVNVPNPKEGWFRRLKTALGQTDEAHGHVRPGYTLPALEELLAECFEVECSEGYSRFFSDAIDTLITFALEVLKRGGAK